MKKIAILILAHKSPTQCKRLITSLSSEYFDIYLHIDLKSDIEPFYRELKEIPNVHFTSNRIATYLDNFSLVEATMTLLKESYDSSNYIYYCLLTGQDYPIKSSSFIYQFLRNSYPLNFIDAYPVKSMEWCSHYGQLRYSQKYRKYELNILGRKLYESIIGKSIRLIFRIIERFTTLIKGKPISIIKKYGYTLSTGSHFWMISDKLAHFYIKEFDNNPINKIFKHIEVPEECYFQTILTKSTSLNNQKTNPFINILDPDIDGVDLPHYRYIKWYQNGIHSNGHPYVITTNDFEKIRNAKSLFARKFDTKIDSQIYDLIDKNILSK